MDNYYLNNAVYLAEEFSSETTAPIYDGEVDMVTGQSTAGMVITRMAITSAAYYITACLSKNMWRRWPMQPPKELT